MSVFVVEPLPFYYCRSEQSSLEDRYEEVKQRLSHSSAAEQKLQEKCEQLQVKLAEKVEERECLQRRVSLLDRESSESKMEATQLRVDIRDATAERNALQEHVIITCMWEGSD